MSFKHHSWTHANLASLDIPGITKEMTLLDDAFIRLIGKTPTYMRPPFYESVGHVLPVMRDLGFHVIQSDINTWDWAWANPKEIQKSIDRFNQGIQNGRTLVLSHDVMEWTVRELVPAMIKGVQQSGRKGEFHFLRFRVPTVEGQKTDKWVAMTVGDCLGDPKANWYRTKPSTAANNVTVSESTATAISLKEISSSQPATS